MEKEFEEDVVDQFEIKKAISNQKSQFLEPTIESMVTSNTLTNILVQQRRDSDDHLSDESKDVVSDIDSQTSGYIKGSGESFKKLVKTSFIRKRKHSSKNRYSMGQDQDNQNMQYDRSQEKTRAYSSTDMPDQRQILKHLNSEQIAQQQQYEQLLQLQQEAMIFEQQNQIMFQAIEQGDVGAFKGVLDSMNNIQVHQLIYVCDKFGYTLIHLCSFFGQLEILEYMIYKFREASMNILIQQNNMIAEQDRLNLTQMKDKLENILITWVNQHTQAHDGWTALHLASTKKSIALFQYLVKKLGADYKLKTQTGISVMHKAAFDNNTYVLSYLKQKGISIDEKDSNGNTALHFACDQKQEYATQWLLAFGAQVNAENQQGETPLHLLVRNSDRLNYSKIARELIVKGANRFAKNKKDQRPLDVLIEDDEERQKNAQPRIMGSLKNELEKVLGENPCYVPCFHIRQPLKKLDRNPSTMAFFVISQLIAHVGLFLFVYPFNPKLQNIYPESSLFILQLVLYIWTSCKDPGVVRKSQQISFLKLNQYFEQSAICPKCEILRPTESRHCYICDRCVDRFDHHCPWLNTCIGIGNHTQFFMFLWAVWIQLACLDYVCIVNLIYKADLQTTVKLFLFPKMPVLGIQIARYTTIGFILVIANLFFIPLTLLLYIQTQNFIIGMTTGSRIRYQEDMRLQKIMQQQNLNQLIDKDDLLNNYEDDENKNDQLIIKELTSHEYAVQSLLNYEDRDRLFIEEQVGRQQPQKQNKKKGKCFSCLKFAKEKQIDQESLLREQMYLNLQLLENSPQPTRQI